MRLPAFQLSSVEFKAALCRQSVHRMDAVFTFNLNSLNDDPRAYECACDDAPKPLGSYGYHFVGCEVDGNAIIIHDTLVHTSV